MIILYQTLNFRNNDAVGLNVFWIFSAEEFLFTEVPFDIQQVGSINKLLFPSFGIIIIVL